MSGHPIWSSWISYRRGQFPDIHLDAGIEPKNPLGTGHYHKVAIVAPGRKPVTSTRADRG